MKKLTHKIEFGFGIQLDKDMQPISPEAAVGMLELLGAWANRQFGGYTLTPTFGSWVNDKGVTFTEHGHTLMVYTDEKGTYGSIAMAVQIKEILRQEAVGVCITEVNARII